MGLQLSRIWRVAAAILLVPVAALMTVGAAGEALAAATPDVPRVVQIVGGAVDTILSAAMLITAVIALIGVVQARREHARLPRRRLLSNAGTANPMSPATVLLEWP